MTITNEPTYRELGERALGERAPVEWLGATSPQCECPEFCPVDHDN